MKNLSRTAVVLVCLAALLLALPVQAAAPKSPQRTLASHPDATSLQWLNASWKNLLSFLTLTPLRPSGANPAAGDQGRGGTGQGGSCIDPDGCF